MRNAPSVQYPVGRCVFERRLQGLLVSGWALMQLAWVSALSFAAPPGAWWVSLLGGILAIAFWHWHSCHALSGFLRWDAVEGRSGQWYWCRESQRVVQLQRVEWPLDLQATVLLRLHPLAGAPLWVWVDRKSCPEQWDAFRRSLKAHSGAVFMP